MTYASSSLVLESGEAETVRMLGRARDPVAVKFRENLRRWIDQYAGGNVSAAAKAMGVPLASLYATLNRYSVPHETNRKLIDAWRERCEQQAAIAQKSSTDEPQGHEGGIGSPEPRSAPGEGGSSVLSSLLHPASVAKQNLALWVAIAINTLDDPTSENIKEYIRKRLNEWEETHKHHK